MSNDISPTVIKHLCNHFLVISVTPPFCVLLTVMNDYQSEQKAFKIEVTYTNYYLPLLEELLIFLKELVWLLG